VVPAAIAVPVGGAAHFARDDQEHLVAQTPFADVVQEGGHRVIDLPAQHLHCRLTALARAGST
jgi:hypothetical protein